VPAQPGQLEPEEPEEPSELELEDQSVFDDQAMLEDQPELEDQEMTWVVVAAGSTKKAADVSVGGLPVTVTVTVAHSMVVTNARLSKGLAKASVAQVAATATVDNFMFSVEELVEELI
jgi:hypothetical protein